MLSNFFFYCLMAYQPSWVTKCQVHPSIKTILYHSGAS